MGGGEEDCQGDVCLPADMELDLSNVEVKSGLPYSFEVKSSVRDILGLCLPDLGVSFLASSFPSCHTSLRHVCPLARRGWLLQDGANQTVANTDLLLSNLGKLAGAEEAVRECMEIPEEYDEYEYYDWEYYDYEYDYLEEAAGSHRVRRDAGRNEKMKARERKAKKGAGRKAKKGAGRKAKKGAGRKAKKGAGRKAKKGAGRKAKKGAGRKAKKGAGRKAKKVKGEKGKKTKKGAGRKKKVKGEKGKKTKKGAGRKKKKEGDKKDKKSEKTARKYTDKKPADMEKNNNKITKELHRLGLVSLPSKAVMDSLDCVYSEVIRLLQECAQDKLNQ